MPGIKVDITHEGDNSEVVIISVHGYIDSTTTPELSMIIDHQIADGNYMFIVNLKGVDYISSIGWGVFISNLKELREYGGDMILINMSPNVHNIFDLMELSSIIKSFDELNKAVELFLGVRKQTALKQKTAGAETSGSGSTTASASATSAKRVQPVQQTPRAAAPKQAPKPTPKSKPKPARIPVNRFGKRPAPIELVSESTVSLDRDDAYYTQERLLEKHIVRVILDKPFLSAGKITKALRLPRYGSVKKNKRKIKQELIKLGLENREDRYEFALRNRR